MNAVHIWRSRVARKPWLYWSSGSSSFSVFFSSTKAIILVYTAWLYCVCAGNYFTQINAYSVWRWAKKKKYKPRNIRRKKLLIPFFGDASWSNHIDKEFKQWIYNLTWIVNLLNPSYREILRIKLSIDGMMNNVLCLFRIYILGRTKWL